MSNKSRRRPAPVRETRARPRPGRWIVVTVGTAIVAVIALALSVGLGHLGQPTSDFSTAGEASGQTVDGIDCQTAEQVVYHIHAHLAVYVNGQPQLIPYGIGIVPPWTVVQSSVGPFVIAGTCFYWLHSHTQDGIIHIESPTERVYTLGNYFDIWNRPLSSTQVGPANGRVIAYLNGQRFTGDPRSIPLTLHALIQLDVGQDIPPQPFAFPQGL